MSTRSTDPITSLLADKENQSHREAQIAKVVKYLARNPAVTSRELSVAMGADRYMVARRLPDAEKKGLVEKVGQRKCLVGGRLSTTWKVVEAKSEEVAA